MGFEVDFPARRRVFNDASAHLVLLAGGFLLGKELLTLHELIGHWLVQIMLGLHRGLVYSV